MGRRAAELRGLVEPMQEKLGKVESQIELLERERREAQGRWARWSARWARASPACARRPGTSSARCARPSTRGAWGEIQLRNVIEMAGMVAHCDFVEQSTLDGRRAARLRARRARAAAGRQADRRRREGAARRLPVGDRGGRPTRSAALHLARHARQTRDHITKLASKGYQSQLDSSPELVVMFVPSEGIYHAALSEDPSLIEYGVEQQVLLATPTTLIGLLRAIHYGWKQEQIAASAREIAETARELHKRIARFVEPFARVGRQLGSAVSAYNEAVGSFEARVMPQLRRIDEAGAGSGRDVELAGVEESPRSLTAAAAEETTGPPALTLAGTGDIAAADVRGARAGG